MSKNVLYITFDGLSDPLGQSQILPYLRGLAAEGYHIHILSCEKKKRLPAEIANIHARLKDQPINWHYILYDEGGGLLTRWWYVHRLKQMANRICRGKQVSLLHCRSYLASLIGLAMKKKRGIPFLFDMRGFWADERIDGEIWDKNKPVHRFLYQYFKRKEKQLLKESSAVISLTSAGLREMEKNYPDLQLGKKTTVIPCCTDTMFFKKNGGENLEDGNATEEHVIVYTGSIGTWYFTREMIDCMLVWKTQIKALKLLILTRDREELDKILSSYDPSVKTLVEVQSASYREMPERLKNAKASIFFIKPAYSKVASSPTKMAECWAMGLPIISNKGIGDNDYYFNEKKGGILLESFDNEAYKKACGDYLAFNRSDAHFRQIALDFFDHRIGVKKYQEIYARLTNQSSENKYF